MSHHATLPLRGPLGALMFGNFVVACGVLVVPGMLDRLAIDLQVSVPSAGQLLSLAALAMCLGAPLFAAFTSRVDRRLLLTLALLALAPPALLLAPLALAPLALALLALAPPALLLVLPGLVQSPAAA